MTVSVFLVRLTVDRKVSFESIIYIFIPITLLKKLYIKVSKKGFSLIEVLMVLLIFTTLIVVIMSSMALSSRQSVNNEISDRARNIGVKVLEAAKKADNKYKDCATGNTLSISKGLYSVPNVNYGTASVSCLQLKQSTYTNSDIIKTCQSNNSYLTKVIFPTGTKYVQYKEEYCIQMIVENITNSQYKKVTIVVVYNNLSEKNIQTYLYGIL